MRLIIVSFALFLIVSLAVTGCYYDKEDLLYGTETCNTTVPATYSTDVSAIMSSHCAVGGCHNASAAASGIILDNYTGVKTQVDNGKLIGVITHSGGFIPMPRGAAKLSDCKIAKIQSWVNAGAPNN